jgi:hypothetical protein
MVDFAYVIALPAIAERQPAIFAQIRGGTTAQSQMLR